MLHILQKTFPLFLFAWLLLAGLSGCGAYSGIAGVPPLTPREFLQQQHWVKIEAGRFSFIWSQPSSTLIVYFVGLFTMYAGYTLLHHRNNQQARLWWGIGLLFSGLGALLAGTGYQAFGYEIKCSGRESCTWTSWWEIVYLWLSVPAMNAFLVAAAYTSASGRLRNGIVRYAVLNTVGYSLLLLYSAAYAFQFGLSFECMALVSAPGVLFLLCLHGSGYAKHKDNRNRVLLNTWLIFMVVGIAYGVYLLSGFAAMLWQHGIWFTENDVLHVGMIGWVYYLFNNTRQVVVDSEPAGS